jgi:hypothetical protein
MILNSPTISGSLTVTGNTTLSGSINVVGGLTGTSSFATTAISSSYSATSTSSSYALASTSASYGLNALTSSNSMTASSADTLYVRNNATVLGSITAQTLVVQTVTSSVLFSTGSNKLGSLLSNTQELTGSVGITGSLSVVTTGTEFQVNAGGVNIGNALTDSHIISGSVTINPNGLFVSSSGNVGIGSTTVTGFTRTLKINTPSGTAGILLTDGDTDRAGFYIDAGTTAPAYIFTNNSKPLVLSVAGAERMRIASTGNVGIGTTTTTSSTNYTSLSINGTTGSELFFKGSNVDYGYMYANSNNVILATQTAIPLLFQTNTSTRMTITSGGNVLIGTSTNSGYKLDVQGTAIVRSDFVVGGFNFYQNNVSRICFAGSTSGNASFSVTVNCSSQTSMKITCLFNHYGSINGYGCARMSFFAVGAGSDEAVINNVATGNGGSWSFARISNTSFSITKNAGSYAGDGLYFIEVVGNSPNYA